MSPARGFLFLVLRTLIPGTLPPEDSDEVLEIGTGRIDRIFVILPDDEGVFHVATGGVSSFYEFRWPTADRLSDEQWWQMLRQGEAPARPTWQEPLFP